MIALLSTSDTDLLSARASGGGYRLGNPSRLAAGEVPAFLDGVTVVVVRILGGRRAWEDGLDAVLAAGLPAVVLGGEQAPDAELMELSTVAAGIVAEAHAYLAHGGPENLRQLARFLSDAVTLTGEGFDPPAPMPPWGLLDRPADQADAGPRPRPVVGILYYRAHHVAGNTGFVH
ncbi:MAG: cobaltochelatase subunit CobN, partial [Trebonia sp.]